MSGLKNSAANKASARLRGGTKTGLFPERTRDELTAGNETFLTDGVKQTRPSGAVQGDQSESISGLPLRTDDIFWEMA